MTPSSDQPPDNRASSADVRAETAKRPPPLPNRTGNQRRIVSFAARGRFRLQAETPSAAEQDFRPAETKFSPTNVAGGRALAAAARDMGRRCDPVGFAVPYGLGHSSCRVHVRRVRPLGATLSRRQTFQTSNKPQNNPRRRPPASRQPRRQAVQNLRVSPGRMPMPLRPLPRRFRRPSEGRAAEVQESADCGGALRDADSAATREGHRRLRGKAAVRGRGRGGTRLARPASGG